MHNRPAALTLAIALSLGSAGFLGACGSSGGGSDSSSDTTKPAAEKTTTTKAAAEPLKILVSNDDGYGAEGIATLVTGLETLDDVEITVVAPLTQQSGQGGKTTEGELAVTDVETSGGYPAKAVDGFPADAVNVAFDELGAEPDLVITGINEGQNLGGLVDISGTVGAARAAVARGVPALATSQGSTSFDYDAAVPLILEWVEEIREAVVAGDYEPIVVNMNIPSCDAGEIRGLVEPEVADTTDGAISAQDCTSTVPEADLATDIESFNNGFATATPVPDEPATPPEVVPAA